MSSPLSIAFVHPSFASMRTAERTVMEQVKLLRRDGLHVAVFTAELSESAHHFFEGINVPVVVLKTWFSDLRLNTPKAIKKAGKKLRPFIKGFTQIIVHHDQAMQWVACAATFKTKHCPPLVWCCYNVPEFLLEKTPTRRTLKQQKLFEKSTPLVTHIFSPSQTSANQLKRLLPCPITPLVFGIDMPIINPPVQKRAKTAFSIGTVSDLEPGKNVTVVIDAFHHFVTHASELGTHVTLDVVGDGSQRRHLEAHAKALGIETKVRFLGVISDADLRRKFQEWEFILCLPLQTAYSRVVLESGIYGKPAIVSNQGGIKELVLDQKTGFLVNPSSVEEISGCIKTLCADPDLVYDMGFVVQDYISEQFDAAKTIAAIKIAPEFASLQATDG